MWLSDLCQTEESKKEKEGRKEKIKEEKRISSKLYDDWPCSYSCRRSYFALESITGSYKSNEGQPLTYFLGHQQAPKSIGRLI